MGLYDTLKRNIIKGLIVVEELPENASARIRAERSKACDGCDKNVGGECTACGCILDIKQGTLRNFNPKYMEIEITHCPLGKWDDADIAKFYRIKRMKS